MASRFSVVEQGPPIEVFQLNGQYLEDNYQNKVNLTVGGELVELFANANSIRSDGLPVIIHYVT